MVKGMLLKAKSTQGKALLPQGALLLQGLDQRKMSSMDTVKIPKNQTARAAGKGAVRVFQVNDFHAPSPFCSPKACCVGVFSHKAAKRKPLRRLVFFLKFPFFQTL